MKKIITVCTLGACLALFFGQAVFAADGAALYRKNCAGCHGQNAERSSGEMKQLLGKPAGDIAAMLQAYKEGGKGVMHGVAQKLSAEDIEAVSAHIGSHK